jgi:hypothetical protein
MNVNLNRPFIQTLGSSSILIWNPTVNARIASETPRTMTPTATSGAHSGDNLIAPGTGTWIVNNQIGPEFSSALAGNDPVSVTIEISTNQGVVTP